MTRTANWTPFVGSGAITLAVVLVIITGLLVALAVWLPLPITVRRPGKYISALLVVIWLLSALMFLVALTAYAAALVQQVGNITGPSDPITPVTFTSGALAFTVILVLTLRNGARVALGSAIVGTIAAPLIFELPFDLIVMWRTFPPTPAPLFTLLFFLPLFLIEITSYALLAMSPAMRLSRASLLLLAGMFLVFAVWALFGFAYPSAPLPTAMNMLSKVLAFAVAIALFLPEGNFAGLATLNRTQGAAAASEQAPSSSE